jgi:hypothetical protein
VGEQREGPEAVNLTTIAAGACALLIAACALLWNLYRAADERADRAEQALKVEAANAHIVTKYVEKIVKVPGPAVVRERLVGRVCHIVDVPGPGRADAAPGENPGDRQPDPAGELAADLGACRRNTMKLEALQEVLRPQL